LGIAEINEHPVTHVFSDESVVPGDRLRDALMIRADYRTQILRVELGRERRRANKVGEHHSQLAAFGVVSPSWLRRQGCRRGRYGNRSVAEIADRPQHFAAIAEQDTKVFKVLVCQVLEDREVNSVLRKPLHVLGHAEFFEPVRNLLHRGHQGRSWSSFWATATKSVPLTATARLVKKRGRAGVAVVLC